MAYSRILLFISIIFSLYFDVLVLAKPVTATGTVEALETAPFETSTIAHEATNTSNNIPDNENESSKIMLTDVATPVIATGSLEALETEPFEISTIAHEATNTSDNIPENKNGSSQIILTNVTTVPLTATPTGSVNATLIQPIVKWIPPPPPPHPSLPNNTLQRCKHPECRIYAVGSKNCATTLARAIEAAPDGGVIEISDNINITSEIVLHKSIEIRSCGSEKHKIIAAMNSTQRTMLRQLGDYVNVSLTNLIFEGTENGNYSVIRTKELEEINITSANPLESNITKNATAPIDPVDGYTTVDIFIQGCRFSNFRTNDLGGSVLFIAGTRWFTILDSEFVNNTVLNSGERYLGGGAVWIRSAQGWLYTLNNTFFANNTHLFEHGQGAAININYLSQGYFELHNSTFINNTASGGGAISMESVEEYAKIHINSTFENNKAIDYGWGARGGVMWLKNINGTVHITGIYKNNTANASRAACFANNWMRANATVTIGGTYINNHAGLGGSIWDTYGSNGLRDAANFTIEEGTIFEENLVDKGDLLVRVSKRVPKEKQRVYSVLHDSDWDGKELVFYAEPKKKKKERSATETTTTTSLTSTATPTSKKIRKMSATETMTTVSLTSTATPTSEKKILTENNNSNKNKKKENNMNKSKNKGTTKIEIEN